MRIDAHIHYLPPEQAAGLADFIREEPFWGLMLAPGAGPGVQGWAAPERMVADMDAAGIDQVWIMGAYRRSHEGCIAENDRILGLMRRWPDRVRGFAVVQPCAGPAALAEAARCLDAGMLGLGELGPYGQGYRLHDPAFLRLAEFCAARGALVNLHTNEEVGHFYPGKVPTPLREYYRLAATLPELKLILAHWGGGLLFYELMPEVRRTLRNVRYDTAASPLLFRTPEIFEVALRCVEPHKVLYASDYPLLPYPRRLREPDFRPFLAEIAALGLPAPTLAALLGGNAERFRAASGPLTRAEPAAAPPPAAPPLTGIDAALPRAGIDAHASVVLLAAAQPATRSVFERYGIPWADSPVAFWEPIVQAAAARGLGRDAVARLIAELREAVGDG